MASKQKTKTDYRSAIDGRFKTKEWAEAHPRNAVKERNAVGKRPKKR